MRDLPFTTSLNDITSEDACKSMAKGLRLMASAFEIRAQDIAQHRRNYKARDDKKTMVWAANRVLNFHLNGACPASECRKLSEQIWVNYDDIWWLYEYKLAAHKAEERKKRNQKIKKWAHDGVSHKGIALRTGLSKGTISRIVNDK